MSYIRPMRSVVQSLYERLREALQTGGSLSLSSEEVRTLADIGAYGLLQEAENLELEIQCPAKIPRMSLAISGSKKGTTERRQIFGKSDSTTGKLGPDTILALIAGTSKTPKEL